MRRPRVRASHWRRRRVDHSRIRRSPLPPVAPVAPVAPARATVVGPSFTIGRAPVDGTVGEGTWTHTPAPKIFPLTVSGSRRTVSVVVNNVDTRKIGQLGGLANTESQRVTRRLNAYRTLAKRYPTSVKVQQELARLERLAGAAGGTIGSTRAGLGGAS
jgi:hypothetical protein